MKIGTYVKYSNDVWEVIYKEAVSDGGVLLDYYQLSCRTSERKNEWAYGHFLIKTSLSQSYFEL